MAGWCLGSERKVRRKRRLVIDELKSIASETMKLQLSDTSEIVSTLDLAPPTKKLMHWKETGGVEKLFAFPGRQIVSRKLSRVYQSVIQSKHIRVAWYVANVSQVYDCSDMLSECLRLL